MCLCLRDLSTLPFLPQTSLHYNAYIVLESVSLWVLRIYLLFSLFQVTWFVKIEPITHSLLCHKIYALRFSLNCFRLLCLCSSVSVCNVIIEKKEKKQSMMQNWEIKSSEKKRTNTQRYGYRFVFQVHILSRIRVCFHIELTFENKTEREKAKKNPTNNVDSFIFSQFDSIEINWFNYDCVYCGADAIHFISLSSVNRFHFLPAPGPTNRLIGWCLCAVRCTSEWHLWKYSWQWPVVQNHHSIKWKSIVDDDRGVCAPFFSSTVDFLCIHFNFFPVRQWND